MSICRTAGEATCPTCGGTIIEDDCFDIEVGTSVALRRCVGTCDHCGNSYTWEEVYEYVGVQNISKNP